MVIDLTRREFLVSVATGAVVLSFASLHSDDGTLLLNENSRTLLAVARTLFPHRSLKDSDYMRAVASIYLRCDSDEEITALFRDGLRSLRSQPIPFLKANEATRVRLLKKLEHSDFFHISYVETLEGLFGGFSAWGTPSS